MLAPTPVGPIGGRYRDPSWENYGCGALITSIILIIFGLLLQILEIVRIYLGLYNYALKNLDLSDNNQFGIWTVRNSFYLFAEPWHIWPWTYAGSLIGLLVLITGLIGYQSYIRRSYTFVYSYYVLSLLSFLLLIFLIPYYSIIIRYYLSYRGIGPVQTVLPSLAQRPDSADESYALVGVQLALTILSMIAAFIAMLVTMYGGKICIRTKTYADFYGNPKHPIIYPFTGQAPFMAAR